MNLMSQSCSYGVLLLLYDLAFLQQILYSVLCKNGKNRIEIKNEYLIINKTTRISSNKQNNLINAGSDSVGVLRVDRHTVHTE